MAGPEIVLVAAVASDGAIGRGNDLLFRDPADQKRFRTLTMGQPVVMGRKTWESLPPRFRPLPGRRNVVLSRDAGFVAEGAETAPDLSSALQRLANADSVCVIGGAQIYAAALPLAHRLELTEVQAAYPDADTFFPPWRDAGFHEAARSPQQAADGTRFDFVTYLRSAA